MKFDSARVLKFNRAFLPLIVLLAAAVYGFSLQNGFVWDDTALVLRDPLIRSWRLIPEGFRHFLFIDATGSNFYRPLQRLTYTMDYALYAFRPWGYHLTNVLLHAAAAGALYALLRRVLELKASEVIASHPERSEAQRNEVEGPRGATGDAAAESSVNPRGLSIALRSGRDDRVQGTLLAAAVASLWAVHPLHSSAVIYVAGRADLLAALFGFLGLNFVLRERWRIAALCFLAALLSKESGVIFLLLGLAIWFGRNARAPKCWIGPLGVTVAVLAVYCALRFSADKIDPPVLTPPAPAAVRPILAARAFAEYAGLLIAPIHLHMERDVSTPTGGDIPMTVQRARLREYQTLVGVLLLIAFGVWLRWTWRVERLACWSLLAFLAAYFPISNALPLNATVAEHWLYVPSAFLLFATALSLNRFPILAKSLPFMWLALLLFFAVRTAMRVPDWRDQRTFLVRTITDGGRTARMLINLGGSEMKEERFENALISYRDALEMRPGQPMALLGMAVSYFRLRDFKEARVWIEKAQALPFVRSEALQLLAAVEYAELGHDRVDLLREAAQAEPRYWPASKRYFAHLAERGETEQAIRELSAYLEWHPFRAESWKILGQFQHTTGDEPAAQRALQRAAQLDVHGS